MSDKWRVLYVDDDPQWLQIADRMFNESKDWELTTAKSIDEVAKFLREEQIFDIALVDLGVGGGEGRWVPKSGEEIA